MTRRSYAHPDQIASRLASHYDRLWVDADHALVSTLTTNGNCWGWNKSGNFADMNGFDRLNPAELRAKKDAREERERVQKEEGEKSRANRAPDPEFDAFFEKHMANLQADWARQKADPAYAAEQNALEQQRKEAGEMQKDPTYRKQVSLLSLSKWSGMYCFPANVKEIWAAAIRRVASMVLDLPDDFKEAVYPGGLPHYNVAEVKKFARDILARLDSRFSPDFKQHDPMVS